MADKHEENTGLARPASDTDNGSQPEYKPAPLWRQMLLVGLIVIILMGVITGIKSHTQTRTPESNNALNPNQVMVSKAAAAAVELKTAPVILEAGRRTIKTNGVVRFSPYSTINVSPRLVGKVRAVLVKVGDHVAEGQPLAEMVSTDAANAVGTAADAEEQLKLTTSFLDTARKQFKLGTPEVTSAEAAYVQAQEATRYAKRALDLALEQSKIGGFTDKPLTDAQSAIKQASTQLSQDQKDLALANSQYERQLKLFAIGTAAKNDVEIAEDTLGKAKDAVDNDKEQLRIANITLTREQKAYDTRLYANQNVEQAQSNYKQAVIAEHAAATALGMAKAALYHDLKQAEHDYRSAITDSHSAQVAVRTYDNPTKDGALIVRAPAAGVITARNVNPGQIVDQTGQTPWQMFTIVNAATVYVDAQLFEKDMAGVRINDPVTARSDALPAGFSAVGRISFVSPGLDAASHALSVRADLDNSKGLLKDGMFVNTVVDVSSHSPFPPTPLVPLTAVVHDGDSDYVFIVQSEGKYLKRKVTLGEQRGEGLTAITAGLNGTETIVTHGAIYLGEGGTALD